MEYWQPDEPDRVLRTRLRLIEMLDDLRLEGCWAQTRVRVIPIFLDVFVPPSHTMARLNDGASPAGSADATVASPGGGGGGGPDPPATVPTPYPQMAFTLEPHAKTDARGYADLTIELADAMAQVMALRREQGSTSPIGVCFDQAFSANCYGVQLPWTDPIGVELIKLEGNDPSLVVDLAKSIVGDTSATHTTLWFQLHGQPREGDRYLCEIVDIAPPGGQRFGAAHLDPNMSGGVVRFPSARSGDVGVNPGAGGLLSAETPGAEPSDHLDPNATGVESDADLGLSATRRRVRLDAASAMTGVTSFQSLRPGALYGYLFKVHDADGDEHVLTQGRFRTFEANPTRMNIAFASCHGPSDDAALGRWKALARRTDQDVLFLIGDQIYGDGVEGMFPSTANIEPPKARWREQYIRRYNQLFAYQPVRDAMRTRPTYMMLDDHDIADDWGVVDLDADRVAGGMEAYRIFQQAHNPGGRDAPILDYHFKRGAAAFYVTDNRTARHIGSGYPVLGQAQYERLKAWSKSADVQDADLVFVMVPVPPGIMPIAALEKWADIIVNTVGVAAGGAAGSAAGALIGGVLGGVGGFILGGPAGAAAGAALGEEMGAITGFVVGAVGVAYEYNQYEKNVKEPDIRDAWTHKDNLSDLVRFLDLLFDVANDVSDNGKPGPKPKGVFVLAGDYHYGAIHHLASRRKRHANNAVMLQVTSSPISKPPVDDIKMNLVIDEFASGTFALDGEHFVSKYQGRIMQRNFGRVAFERVGPGRRYYIQTFVEGETDTLAELYELDLDKKPIVMRNMVGEILAVRGRISLLRVHDLNTGYGPPGDKINGEVIVQLDTAPGRAFGFQLRRDNKLSAHKAMLEVLRDAITHDRMVAIDYRRTGLSNGTLIRASVIIGAG